MSENPVAVKDSEKTGTWRDIEPLLKWVAVAYGLGFFTVLVHTARLGIPVLQLIESVNVWIGAPLALVLYFADKIGHGMKTARLRLLRDLARAKEMSEELAVVHASPELLNKFVAISTEAFSMALSTGFFLPDTRRVIKWLFELAVQSERKRLQDDSHNSAKNDTDTGDLERRIRSTGRVMHLMVAMGAFQRFLQVSAVVLLIPIACFLYIWSWYPLIPQTIGGGRPVQVRMIVNIEKLPRAAEDIRDFFDTAAGTKPADARASMTTPVTLHYQTENSYYVSKAGGPIIYLNREVIDGIVFVK